MKLIKIGSAVLNQTPLDWEGNKKNIIEAIEEAKRQKVKILCLPELCISGYGCEDAFHSPDVQATAWQVLHEIIPATRGIIVALGLPISFHNGIFNTACLVADGKIQGFAAKRFLAGDGIHYEPRWFKPWPKGKRVDIEHNGEKYPLGDCCFECGEVRIGFEICEDAWVADRPGSDLALRGVDIILNPSASHFAFGKYEVRKRFVLEGSRAFGVTYLYSNLLGNESGRAIYDGGALIASAGRLLASGPRFSYANWKLTTAITDIETSRMIQGRTGSFEPDLNEALGTNVRFDFVFPDLSPEPINIGADAWESSAHIKEEEFSRAVSLGLFDYLRKSQSKGFVVSLSGGADSSAVSCLVWLMVNLGTKELGVESFAKKVALSLPKEKNNTKAIVQSLLTCIYQSTANSSETTRTAAQKVAEEIGATFYEFDLEKIVQDYRSAVSSAMKYKLSWEKDDIALQNIQARVRSPSAWLVTNLKNALLLSTSNRSEVAVGYATMDGDTSGGLSPVGGIDKAYLRKWLRWLEKEGPGGSPGVSALSYVNAQAPTAELRPSGDKQTDEADLMPYEILDLIERSAVRDKRSPLEIYRLLSPLLPDEKPEQLVEWIERFFKLWCRNQWKRERYAPSFHLDDENLDPRTWCRFPILSGSYARELGVLRKTLAAEILKGS